jgi:hypothetical protein
MGVNMQMMFFLKKPFFIKQEKPYLVFWQFPPGKILSGRWDMSTKISPFQVAATYIGTIVGADGLRVLRGM